VAQVRSPASTEAALDAVEDFTARAVDDGARLVLFPEALLGGYPRGATFGAVVGERSAAGRDEFLAYSAGAVTIPGPEVEQLARIAQAQAGAPGRWGGGACRVHPVLREGDASTTADV